MSTELKDTTTENIELVKKIKTLEEKLEKYVEFEKNAQSLILFMSGVLSHKVCDDDESHELCKLICSFYE